MVKFELCLKNKLLLSNRRVQGREVKTFVQKGKGRYALTNFMIEAWNGVRECMRDKEGRDRIPKALSDT